MQMDTELALDYSEDFVYTLGLATRAVQVGCYYVMLRPSGCQWRGMAQHATICCKQVYS